MKTKVAILGANGFIGKELANRFEQRQDYEVYKVTRSRIAGDEHICDYTDLNAMTTLFKDRDIDHVINATGPKDAYTVLRIHHVLRDTRKFYDKLFNLGSGAEYDLSGPIKSRVLTNPYDYLPADEYGFAKNLIARECISGYEAINIRIFGCFGLLERSTRLFRNNFDRIVSGRSPMIHQNRLFDYFYVGDLYRVITRLIEDEYVDYVDSVDCVYKNKVDLNYVMKQFLGCLNYSADLQINLDGMGLPYLGYYSTEFMISLDLVGLERGIEKIAKGMLNEC